MAPRPADDVMQFVSQHAAQSPSERQIIAARLVSARAPDPVALDVAKRRGFPSEDLTPALAWAAQTDSKINNAQ